MRGRRRPPSERPEQSQYPPRVGLRDEPPPRLRAIRGRRVSTPIPQLPVRVAPPPADQSFKRVEARVHRAIGRIGPALTPRLHRHELGQRLETPSAIRLLAQHVDHAPRTQLATGACDGPAPVETVRLVPSTPVRADDATPRPLAEAPHRVARDFFAGRLDVDHPQERARRAAVAVEGEARDERRYVTAVVTGRDWTRRRADDGVADAPRRAAVAREIVEPPVEPALKQRRKRGIAQARRDEQILAPREAVTSDVDPRPPESETQRPRELPSGESARQDERSSARPASSPRRRASAWPWIWQTRLSESRRSLLISFIVRPSK